MSPIGAGVAAVAHPQGYFGKDHRNSHWNPTKSGQKYKEQTTKIQSQIQNKSLRIPTVHLVLVSQWHQVPHVSYLGPLNTRAATSRRVWEWWRSKHTKLTYFFTAARLVALVPVSSAFVERVFSQVKFIIESVGQSLLEETLEARVMERVNRY